MLNEGEEEDDVSFYVKQQNESCTLKSISGFHTGGNLSDNRARTNRLPPLATDDYIHEPRERRPSIVIREHQLAQYPINYDPSPHIIRRKADEHHEPIVYKQQVAIRYLCPPTPPPAPPLIIREIRQPSQPPLPPIIIRQRPQAPVTPPPLIIRERPPTPPSFPSTPQIIIKHVPPTAQPTRSVIIERLPRMPGKPPDIIVERWLPYKQPKRQVIYEKAFTNNSSTPINTDQQTQGNVIIQYANPSIRIEKQMRSMGIVRRDPSEKLDQSIKSPSDHIYHNFVSPTQFAMGSSS